MGEVATSRNLSQLYYEKFRLGVTTTAIACPEIQLGLRRGEFLDSLLASTANEWAKLAWYALQVRSRKESYVASQISGQGYECLLPMYKSIRNWSDRRKEVEQPLFPGYLFCRFKFQQRRPVLFTSGVLQIVGTGRIPTPVSDDEIGALQVAVSSGVARQPWPYLEVGQRVRVNYGALAGLEGILVNLKGNHRVVLSVTLLQRSVAMEVDTAWLTPVREFVSSSMTPGIPLPIRASQDS
jgi:transcription elongation factor/antiterminator RfaH